MFLYRIYQEEDTRQIAASNSSRPVLTPEEIEELLEQLEEERKTSTVDIQDDPYVRNYRRTLSWRI